MYQVNGITDAPLQTMTLNLYNGNPLSLTMYYVSMQYGWFLENITYGNLVITGMRICVSPNMLIQYQNQLDFGLACSGVNEPTQQQSFLTGVNGIFILTTAEAAQYAEYLSGQQIPT